MLILPSVPMLLHAITALRGMRLFFLTGTDEHGVKMVKTAAGEGNRAAAVGGSECGGV